MRRAVQIWKRAVVGLMSAARSLALPAGTVAVVVLTGIPIADPPAPAAQAPVPPPKPRIDFRINIKPTAPAETRTSLFNVTVNTHLQAVLANLGTETAHRVGVVTRARVGDDYIAINGKDHYIHLIGVLPPNQKRVEQMDLSLRMSLWKGVQARGDGIIFEVTIVSAEKTETRPPLLCTHDGCEYLGEAPEGKGSTDEPTEIEVGETEG
jgi:hypothetical protein